jgi:hypothetical protein
MGDSECKGPAMIPHHKALPVFFAQIQKMRLITTIESYIICTTRGDEYDTDIYTNCWL